MTNPFDFKDTVRFYATKVDEDAIKNVSAEPSKLMFNASRLEDVIFRIGDEEYTIDFPSLVRDYGEKVEQ